MIAPFNPSVIARAIEVVRRSGADTELLALLCPPSRGRRPSYNTTAFLVGAILAVQWKGSLVIRDLHRVLTERLPVDVHRELGVRKSCTGGERLIAEKDLYAITEAIWKYLEYGTGSAPHLDNDERERRLTAVLDLLHRLLGVTLPQSPSESRAIDGSGIWSYGSTAWRTNPGIFGYFPGGHGIRVETRMISENLKICARVPYQKKRRHSLFNSTKATVEFSDRCDYLTV